MLYLAGVVPEPVLLDLDKAEVADRLAKAVERGDLAPELLGRLDTALPIAVLEQLGYAATTLRKAEAAAAGAIRKTLEGGAR